MSAHHDEAQTLVRAVLSALHGYHLISRVHHTTEEACRMEASRRLPKQFLRAIVSLRNRIDEMQSTLAVLAQELTALNPTDATVIAGGTARYGAFLLESPAVIAECREIAELYRNLSVKSASRRERRLAVERRKARRGLARRALWDHHRFLI